MPGKRVEFRPTVQVCDGSPERLHDAVPPPPERQPPPPPPPPVRQPPPGSPPQTLPAAPRGCGDGADSRRSQTLPLGRPRLPPGQPAPRGQVKPGHPNSAGSPPGGRVTNGRPRPASVLSDTGSPRSAHQQHGQVRCFQCVPVRQYDPGWMDQQQWRAHASQTLPTPARRAAPADNAETLPREYRYRAQYAADSDSATGSGRRTWVKPSRAHTAAGLGESVDGSRPDRAGSGPDTASAARLLNHDGGPAMGPAPAAVPASRTVRAVGWLCRAQVIAFICGLIVLVLTSLALASSDWLLSDGWRQGLFVHCTDRNARRPLPFDLPFHPGCHRARNVAYILVSEALVICCLALDLFATVLAGLGLWTAETSRKYRYYRSSLYVMIISLITILIALVLYPVCFAQELEESYRVAVPEPGNRTVWEFGWAYGVGWGAAIFLFGAVILLLCDKESTEIYHKERTIHQQQTA